jgi:gluconate 2-dehydrogenase gamma chain
MNEDKPVDRRGFLKVVGATGAMAGAATTPLAPAAAQAPAPAHTHAEPATAGATTPGADGSLSGWTFFNPDEVTFVKAALDVIIPSDPTGPGAVEAGCATYMDRQLAGAFGRGARLYLQGPFLEGTPQQGYQLPLTPAELIRIGISDVDTFAQASRKKTFASLTAQERTDLLKEVETNKAQLANVPGATWFGQFLNLTMEGYFADPIYGGNKNKAAWKMIGFPGVPHMYADIIEEYRNKPFNVEPRSIQDLA